MWILQVKYGRRERDQARQPVQKSLRQAGKALSLEHRFRQVYQIKGF
ncbi:MAG TPA: hypothetical protein VE082_00180 [Desulfobaccales bacterium]|nr:hypothetical protein [Desulfobaccales bacterium]